MALVGFVSLTWVAAVAVAATAMPWSGNWAAAILAGALVLGMAAYAVPSFGGVQARWAASGFFHLAFSFTVGPPAILTMAVAESLGVVPRRKPGAFRTAANISNHFLADASAWATFHWVAGAHPSPLALAVAGVAGALSEGIVNRVVLMISLWLAHEPASVRGWGLNLAQSLPVVVPFGVTASAAIYLNRAEGTWGIVTLLLPLAIVQASMVALARRAHAQARAQEREAEALRREARASRVAARRSGGRATPPRWSARGSPPTSTTASSRTCRGSCSAPAQCWAVLPTATRRSPPVRASRPSSTTRANLAAEAVRELRTLMVELAPPLLDEEGLSSALRQLLSRLDRDHISWVLECTEEPLDQRQQRLAYRVIQEALRNVVKHAECHTVWVAVRTESDRLLVSIRDDGRGFSAAERAEQRKKGHAGLGLLAQTARDGGGELSVTSARGKGTRVEMSVPMLPPTVAEETTDGDEATVTAAPGSRPGVDGQAVMAGGGRGRPRDA